MASRLYSCSPLFTALAIGRVLARIDRFSAARVLDRRKCVNLAKQLSVCAGGSSAALLTELTNQCQRRYIHTGCPLFSGSNHYSKIKHKKAARDTEKSVFINRMILKINKACKEGGGNTDPKLNSALAKVLQVCQDENVPKATITRALERISKRQTGKHLVEMKGPAGSFFILQMLTDNKNQSVNYLKRVFRKISAHFELVGEQVRRDYFAEKGVVAVLKEAEDAPPLTLEEAETLAIELNAEEVDDSYDENGNPTLEFVCEVKELAGLQEALGARGCAVVCAEEQFRAVHPITLPDADMKLVKDLFDALDTNEDVEKVFDNLAV